MQFFGMRIRGITPRRHKLAVQTVVLDKDAIDLETPIIEPTSIKRVYNKKKVFYLRDFFVINTINGQLQ